MGALDPVAGSLIRLKLESTGAILAPFCRLKGISSLSSFTQLTALSLSRFEFGAEEPWTHLAGLTNLRQLKMQVAASGDPSPLSALAGLSSLHLSRCQDGATPGAFSNLQPLSTLQQLVLLYQWSQVYSATSLDGLAQLSRLEALGLNAPMLSSLEGGSPGLTSLALQSAQRLKSPAAIEQMQGLQNLIIDRCGVTVVLYFCTRWLLWATWGDWSSVIAHSAAFRALWVICACV